MGAGAAHQGSTRVDVGDGDAAFVEQFLLAYDTEVRLQRQALTPKATIEDITIEAGPTYFAGAAEKVKDAVATASEHIKQRENAPYNKGTAATGK